MRVGVIGTNWGRMHVGAFRAAGAEVVALCGRDEAKTVAVAQAEGIPLGTTSVDALCAESELVVVASPDGEHAAHITSAWRHGRAVLCEKPLTFSADEATALATRSRSERLSVMNFPYRWLAPLVALERFLVGRRLRQLTATVRLGTLAATPGTKDGPLMGGSADFGGASHVVDAALWLSGSRPAWVSASLAGRPVHSLNLQVGLQSGALVVLGHAPAPEPGIHGGWTLLGEGWEVGFSAGYVPERGGWCLSPIRAFEPGRGWFDVHPGAEPSPGELEPWAKAHAESARVLVEALRGGPPSPRLPSFDAGAEVQRVLHAALRSEREGRRVNVDG